MHGEASAMFAESCAESVVIYVYMSVCLGRRVVVNVVRGVHGSELSKQAHLIRLPAPLQVQQRRCTDLSRG